MSKLINQKLQVFNDKKTILYPKQKSIENRNP